MAKINQNFSMYQGEEITLQLPVVDAANAPLAMTGGTPEWKMGLTAFAATAVITKTPTIISVNATDDGLQIIFADTDTVSLTPRDYYHEFELIDSAGTRIVLATGIMTILPSLTK